MSTKEKPAQEHLPFPEGEKEQGNLDTLLQEIDEDIKNTSLDDLLHAKERSEADAALILLEGEKGKLQLAVERIQELSDREGCVPDAARASILEFVHWLEHPRKADDEDLTSGEEDLVASTLNLLSELMKQPELIFGDMTVEGVQARFKDRIASLNVDIGKLERKLRKKD